MKITFMSASGSRREVEAGEPLSAMEVAVANDIDGVVAVCRGSCACGTCHVYVEEKWLHRLAPINEMEDEILGTLALRRPNSRLSCQIKLCESLDGLVLETPETQG